MSCLCLSLNKLYVMLCYVMYRRPVNQNESDSSMTNEDYDTHFDASRVS